MLAHVAVFVRGAGRWCDWMQLLCVLAGAAGFARNYRGGDLVLAGTKLMLGLVLGHLLFACSTPAPDADHLMEPDDCAQT